LPSVTAPALVIYSNNGIPTTPVENASLTNAPVPYNGYTGGSTGRGNESTILYVNTSSDSADTSSYTTQVSTDKATWTDITTSDPSDVDTSYSYIIGQNITSLNNNAPIYYFRIKNNRSYSTAWSPIVAMDNGLIYNNKLNISHASSTAPKVTGKTYNGTVSSTLSWSAPSVIPTGETIQYYSLDMKPTGISLINALVSFNPAQNTSYNAQASYLEFYGSATNPVLIMNTTNIVKITSSYYNPLIIDNNNKLYGWGYNGNNSLGNYGYISTYNNNPTQLSANNNWIDVDGGQYYTLAINSSGELYATGDNYYGQLGDGYSTYQYGSSYNKTNLTKIGSSSNWTKVSCSYCVSHLINSLGELYGTGFNENGQVGTTSTYGNIVGGLRKIGSANNWTQVSSGGYSTYAINSSGELYGWGYNNFGQVGDGTTTSRFTPVRIGSSSNWVSVSAGAYWVHAINSAGELYGWGYNASNQLGDGTAVNRNVPTRIGSANNWSKIVNPGSNGSSFALAIDTSGKLFAWGGTESWGIGSVPIIPTSIPSFAPYKVTNIGKTFSGNNIILATISISSADYIPTFTTTNTSQTLPYSDAGKFFTVRAVFTNGNSSPRSNLKI
jgi:alpha-tubulin suppressor-like RCC1 family protein